MSTNGYGWDACGTWFFYCIYHFRNRIFVSPHVPVFMSGRITYWLGKGIISTVFLPDAAIETLSIAGWLWLGFSSAKGDKTGGIAGVIPDTGK